MIVEVAIAGGGRYDARAADFARGEVAVIDRRIAAIHASLRGDKR